MVSDSIAPSASIPSSPKDFPKKKRANRSAKLKQNKLDARREQWLSQGAVKNKGSKEESTGQRSSRCDNETKNAIEDLETGRRDRGSEEEKERGLIYHDFDSDSPSNSPSGSSVLSSADAGISFTGSSSSSSGGCCSGNITEEEEEVDDNCLDDWEAVADALAANDTNKHGDKDDHQCLDSESSHELEPCEDLKQGGGQQPEPPKVAPSNCRAWRSDDAFRPQSLPNLSKQRSFPNADRCFGKGVIPWSCLSAVPSSCPICCEELDVTDTSFLPCICGFRLCLFCYNRIRNVEDGRCPGCRKPYEGNAMESELSVNGGCLTFRLSRTYSMVARS